MIKHTVLKSQFRLMMKKTLLCLLLAFILLLAACGPYRVTIELAPNGSGGSFPPIIPPVTLPPVTTPGPVYTSPIPTGPAVTDPPVIPSVPELEAALSNEITTDDGFVLALNESGTYTLVGIVGKDRATLLIPDEHEGIPVTRMEENVFKLHDEITGLILPEQLEQISERAFVACDKLNYTEYRDGKYLGSRENPYKYLIGAAYTTQELQLTLHNDCTLIADGALYQNGYITSLTVASQGIIAIGARAFYNCNKLKSVNIKATVESVGYSAFSGCSALTEFDCDVGVIRIESSAFNSCASLPDFDFKITEYIGGYAFRGCSMLKSVVLPASVYFIGEYAFCEMPALARVVLSPCIETLYKDSFPSNAPFTEYSNCKYLGNSENPYLYLMSGSPDSAAEPALAIHKDTYGIARKAIACGEKGLSAVSVLQNQNSKYLTSEGNCVYERESGKLVLGSSQSVIPDAVTSIGSEAFAYAHSLEAIAIPKTVTEICEKAFMYCRSLVDISFEERQNALKIGDNAFAQCEELAIIDTGDIPVTVGNSAFYNCSSMSSATIKNAQSIGTQAFAFSGISIFIGPDSFEYVPESCFYYCQKLVMVSLPSVKTIKSRAFQGSGLRALPDMKKLEIIGNEAFADCPELSEAVFREGIIAIDENAFKKCTALCSLDLSDSLLYIGDSAFAYCTSLTAVKLPAMLDTIRDSCFIGCRSLKNLEFGNSVKVIEPNALSACTSLENIKFNGTLEDWTEIEKDSLIYDSNAVTVTCNDDVIMYNIPS